MDDPFIREHIEDLLRNIRTQVMNIIAVLQDGDMRFLLTEEVHVQFVNFSLLSLGLDQAN